MNWSVTSISRVYGDSLSGDLGPDNTLTTPNSGRAIGLGRRADAQALSEGDIRMLKWAVRMVDRGEMTLPDAIKSLRDVGIDYRTVSEEDWKRVSRSDSEARTDPPTSEAQRRAMRAAAEGKSKLGISRSVGEEFSEADPGGELPERKR